MHQAAWWEGNGLRLCLCLCANSDVEDSSSSDVPDLEECNVEEELDEIVEGLTITHDDAVLVVSDTEMEDPGDGSCPPPMSNINDHEGSPAPSRKGSAAYYISKQHDKIYPGTARICRQLIISNESMHYDVHRRISSPTVMHLLPGLPKLKGELWQCMMHKQSSGFTGLSIEMIYLCRKTD
jgi:hypothetical protein